MSPRSNRELCEKNVNTRAARFLIKKKEKNKKVECGEKYDVLHKKPRKCPTSECYILHAISLSLRNAIDRNEFFRSFLAPSEKSQLISHSLFSRKLRSAHFIKYVTRRVTYVI